MAESGAKLGRKGLDLGAALLNVDEITPAQARNLLCDKQYEKKIEESKNLIYQHLKKKIQAGALSRRSPRKGMDSSSLLRLQIINGPSISCPLNDPSNSGAAGAAAEADSEVGGGCSHLALG